MSHRAQRSRADPCDLALLQGLVLLRLALSRFLSAWGTLEVPCSNHGAPMRKPPETGAFLLKGSSGRRSLTVDSSHGQASRYPSGWRGRRAGRSEPGGWVGGSALADVTIDFEQYPPGTVLTGGYANQGGAGQGVVFGPLPAGAGVGDGLRPVIRTPPTGQAQSGSRVADIATCVGCEFFTPRTTGTLFVPRSRLSVYVGYLGEPAICTAIDPNAVGCAFVRLRAFNAAGGQVAESSVRVTRGAGIRSLLSVSTSSATIVGFEISGRPALDDSKPIAIDDLVFGTPDPAPAPDFTLNPSTANVIVEQGEQVTVPIAIGRLNGSSGDIALRAEGLPQGVAAASPPTRRRLRRRS